MLKIEKNLHTGLTLRLREREKFFQPQILKALAFAFFFHATLLVLFEIIPFHTTTSFTFGPIQVHAELPYQSSPLQVSKEDASDFAMEPPPLTFIPAFDRISLPPISSFKENVKLDLDAFDFIEKHIWPSLDRPLSLDLQEPLVQMTISGNLSQYLWISESRFLKLKGSYVAAASPFYLSFEVQAESRNGKIFWFEKIQGSPLKHIDIVAEEIIKSLKFSFMTAEEILTGRVNFAIFSDHLNLDFNPLSSHHD